MPKGASHEFAFVAAPFALKEQNHETQEIHERKNGLFPFVYFVCFVVSSFIFPPLRQGSGLGAARARTPRYKEGGRAGRCSDESENSG